MLSTCWALDGLQDQSGFFSFFQDSARFGTVIDASQTVLFIVVGAGAENQAALQGLSAAIAYQLMFPAADAGATTIFSCLSMIC